MLPQSLICLLFILWQPVAAEWFFVSETEYDYLLIDTTTLSIDGDFRTIWGRSELKNRHSDQQIKSSRYLKEFNCTKRLERVLTLTMFTENNGQGDAVGSKHLGSWYQVFRNTAAGDVLEFVCLMQ